jgi:hypothetical protein
VLRSTPNAAHSGNECTALGVILEGVTPATQKILVDLCDRWSESPPVLTQSERRRGAAPAVETRVEEVIVSRPRPEDSKAQVKETSEPKADDQTTAESQAHPSDTPQRSTRRGVFEREILQVDEEARVVQSLLGRDLSTDGIHVARQLGLAQGDKLQLALFDTAQQEPLILNAEVSSDDDGSGFFLHFVDLSAEATAHIEEILERLPAVESIDAHGDAGVIPAGVVSNRA